jgi:GLPGLI family protein
MKTFFLTVLSFLFFNQVSAQNVEVNYYAELSKSKQHAVLVFDNNQSYFQIKNLDFDKEKNINAEVVSGDEIKVILDNNKSSIMAEMYKNSSIDNYLINFPTKDSTVSVVDNVPKIKWEIVEKHTKKILGFKCQKAIATFRGTPLVAFFTPDISTSFGPEKFDGLPGLILEIYDSTAGLSNRYLAYDIDFKSDSEIKKIKKNKLVLDYKAYIKLSEIQAKKEIDNYLKQVLSSAPRGAKIEKDGGLKRSGFEKEFEWEK